MTNKEGGKWEGQNAAQKQDLELKRTAQPSRASMHRNSLRALFKHLSIIMIMMMILSKVIGKHSIRSLITIIVVVNKPEVILVNTQDSHFPSVFCIYACLFI